MNFSEFLASHPAGGAAVAPTSLKNTTELALVIVAGTVITTDMVGLLPLPQRTHAVDVIVQNVKELIDDYIDTKFGKPFVEV